MKIYYRWCLFILFLLFHCVNLYNPFKDSENAGLVVRAKSFTENDTFTIFERETLFTTIKAKELLDSFSLQCLNNHLWQDTIVRNQKMGPAYEFHLSLFDTGKQVIIITSFPKGLDPKTQVIEFYTITPLKTDTIFGDINKPILLHASAVGDEDVFYHWDLGDGIDRYSFEPIKLCTLNTNPVETKSWVWISDQYHSHSSPKTAFYLNLRDTKAPIMYCENKPQLHDTVFTGDSLFVFKLRIFDIDNHNAVDSASINGVSFEFTIKSAKLYLHTFENMHTFTKASPFTAQVFARDNRTFKNDTIHTFYLCFDPQLQNTSTTHLIVYNSTGESNIEFTDTFFPILGRVETLEKKEVILRAFLNNSAHSNNFTFPDGTGEWKWFFFLSPKSLNTIRIEALDSSGDFLTAETLSVYHTVLFDDKENPIISRIRVNDSLETSPDSFFTTLPEARLSILTYDNHSLVNQVSINGQPAIPSNDNLEWTLGKVSLIHQLKGNNFSIRVKDMAGNSTTKTITIFTNNLPTMTLLKPFPSHVYLDTTYTIPYSLEDLDNFDTLVILPIDQLDSFVINRDKHIFSWTPQRVNIGPQSIVCSVSDGYDFGTVLYNWNCMVLENPLPPVQFLSTSQDLPDSLVYQKDSLTHTLHITPKTGIEPFLFSVFNTTTSKFIIKSSNDSTFSWIPSYDDVGVVHFQFSVLDSVQTIDTFSHSIAVSALNQYPCHMSLFQNTTTIHTFDTLTLSSMADTILLNAIIYDDDHPSTEQYSVSYTILGFSVQYVTQDKNVTLKIIPKTNISLDTLVLSVTDRTGTTIQYSLYIKHPGN